MFQTTGARCWQVWSLDAAAVSFPNKFQGAIQRGESVSAKNDEHAECCSHGRRWLVHLRSEATHRRKHKDGDASHLTDPIVYRAGGM
jgi:hypothetical protein